MKIQISNILISAITGGVLILNGCSSTPTPPIEKTNTSSKEQKENFMPLEIGKTWSLDKWRNSQGQLVKTLAGSTVTLSFEASKLAGKSGCNRYFSSYEQNNGTLSIKLIGSTMMACAPEVMSQEYEYLQLLQKSKSYHMSAEQLQLLNAEGQVMLYFSAVPA